MNNSMFIAAGVHTSVAYFQKYFDKDELERFIQAVCPKGLISFGTNLTSKTKNKKIIPEKHIKNLIKVMENSRKINSLDMYLDSGGYQVTTGLVPRSEIDVFIETYKKFLIDYTKYYDVAFSLDIPVLPDITTQQEMLDLNIKAYNIIDELPENLKDKQIFVSHFRLKELYEIWNKLIFEHEIIKKYKRFSIGGLVASQPAVKKLYFNLYSLGILQIIFGLNKQLPDPFYLHILGSATSTNIIYFTLLERHLSHLLGKTELTFDSSAVFTKVQVGRTFTYFDEKEHKCYDVDIRERFMDIKIPCGKTPTEIIYELFDEINQKANIKRKKPEFIYHPDTGTWDTEMRNYILAIESYALNKISNFCRKYSEYLYDFYKKDELKFINELNHLFTNFNKGKISDVSIAKSTSIKNSLDTIQDFIENKTKEDLFRYFENLSPILDTEQTNDVTHQFNFLGD